MKDRPFLAWLHSRLENRHRENPRRDYMRKLRAIIAATPAERETPSTTRAGDGLADIGMGPSMPYPNSVIVAGKVLPSRRVKGGRP